MPLTVGGGVRTIEDIGRLLHAGADKVSINTAAVNNRQFVKEASEKFGAQCIVVAIDAKRVSGEGEPLRWEIFTHGGRKPTGIDAVAIRQGRRRARRGRDPAHLHGPRRHQGRLRPGADARRLRCRDHSGHRLGRRRQPRSLVEGVTKGHASAVLAASIFHFGTYSIGEAKRHMAAAGIAVRPAGSTILRQVTPGGRTWSA